MGRLAKVMRVPGKYLHLANFELERKRRCKAERAWVSLRVCSLASFVIGVVSHTGKFFDWSGGNLNTSNEPQG